MKSHRKYQLFALVILAAAVIRIISFNVECVENKIELWLTCRGDRCIASVNGVPKLALLIPDRQPCQAGGQRLGLYVFHSYETPDNNESFNKIIVEPLSTNNSPAPISKATIDLSNETICREAMDLEGDWHVKSGSGLKHSGKTGDRATALFKDITARDFRVALQLTHPVDCGIMFRAEDKSNGLVLVIRQEKNDIFFFRLVDGEPQQWLDRIDIKKLVWHKELLRLAGLVSDLVLRTAFFILLALLAVKRLPVLTINSRISLPDNTRPAPAWLYVVMFAIATGVPAFTSIRCFHGIPHVTDEAVYLFQARIFAEGKLWAPVPDFPEFFAHEHLLMENGRWYSKYPPLFSMLLVPAAKAGIPWLYNPIAGGIMSLLIFAMARNFAGTRCALLAWALTVSSPSFIFMGANYMSHMTTAVFVLAFLMLIFKAIRSERHRLFLPAALCLGAAAATRPFTAAMVAIPGILYVCIHIPALWRRKCLMKSIVYGMLGIIPVLLLYILWNILNSPEGGFDLSLYTDYDASDRLGFGPEMGKGWYKTWGSWGHTPAKAIRSVYNYLEYYSRNLFGWPWRLSLSFIAVPFFMGRKRIEYVVFMLVFLALAVGHMFYWAAWYIFFGVRYWFSALPGLVILSAVGIREVVTARSKPTSSRPDSTVQIPIGAILLSVALLAFVFKNVCFHIPERFAEGPNYGNISSALRDEVEKRDLHEVVIFAKTSGLIFNDGFFMNDPFMQGDRIFARDLGPRNRDFLAAHPGYKGYVWDKKTLRPMDP